MNPAPPLAMRMKERILTAIKHSYPDWPCSVNCHALLIGKQLHHNVLETHFDDFKSIQNTQSIPILQIQCPSSRMLTFPIAFPTIAFLHGRFITVTNHRGSQFVESEQQLNHHLAHVNRHSDPIPKKPWNHGMVKKLGMAWTFF